MSARSRGIVVLSAAVIVAVVAGIGVILLAGRVSPDSARGVQPESPLRSAPPVDGLTRPSPTPVDTLAHPSPAPVDPMVLAALPEARYDAVIPELIGENNAETLGASFTLESDAALNGSDRLVPVAKLSRLDFLGEPTVVVPVAMEGGWVRILTPARQRLPSSGPGPSPAQTSAWMSIDLLAGVQEVPHHVVIALGARTMTILDGTQVQSSYSVGIGALDTPTPSTVTGYLQARYLDPAQGQTVHPVQLTSLHATADDEPYGGTDGGLIGLHFSDSAAGAVSHGCIRLDDEAIEAVNALPLGTPVSIDP